MNSLQISRKLKSSSTSNFTGSVSELFVPNSRKTSATSSELLASGLRRGKSIKKGGNPQLNKYVDDFMNLLIEKDSNMNNAKYRNYLSNVQEFYYQKLKNKLSDENLKEIFKKIKERIDENNNKLKELPKFQKNLFTSDLLTNKKFFEIVKKPSVKKNISKIFFNKLEKNEKNYGRFNKNTESK
jgi:hypothetical protein